MFQTFCWQAGVVDNERITIDQVEHCFSTSCEVLDNGDKKGPLDFPDPKEDVRYKDASFKELERLRNTNSCHRFGFFECLLRVAVQKYRNADTGMYKTHPDAFKKLLEDIFHSPNDYAVKLY